MIEATDSVWRKSKLIKSNDSLPRHRTPISFWCVNSFMLLNCWKIKVRIVSARNICDPEHSRAQFHCTGGFIPGIISAHIVFYFSFHSIQAV